MKSTGIVRRIDELGRFVIPKEIREQLDIVSNTPIEIILDGDNVILKKFEKNHKCLFCNSDNSVKEFKEKYVCDSCIKELNSK